MSNIDDLFNEINNEELDKEPDSKKNEYELTSHSHSHSNGDDVKLHVLVDMERQGKDTYVIHATLPDHMIKKPIAVVYKCLDGNHYHIQFNEIPLVRAFDTVDSCLSFVVNVYFGEEGNDWVKLETS